MGVYEDAVCYFIYRERSRWRGEEKRGAGVDIIN